MLEYFNQSYYIFVLFLNLPFLLYWPVIIVLDSLFTKVPKWRLALVIYAHYLSISWYVAEASNLQHGFPIIVVKWNPISL